MVRKTRAYVKKDIENDVFNSEDLLILTLDRQGKKMQKILWAFFRHHESEVIKSQLVFLPYFTIKQFCKIAQISQQTLYRYIQLFGDKTILKSAAKKPRIPLSEYFVDQVLINEPSVEDVYRRTFLDPHNEDKEESL